jgi:MoaA/NifB/PqqE/SkfB family radical SAM enzyme
MSTVSTPKLTGTLRTRYGPAGIHLFDRASGINLLLDEVSVPSEHWSLAPRQVSIALTNACDLACPYCYAPKFRSSLEMSKLCGWLMELEAGGCLGVGFGGGEPALYPHLAQVCRWATANTRMAVTMTSHGHHLDDALLAALQGNINFVRISMDGIEGTYESLRHRPFDDLMERLRSIRAIVPFGINYVVNATTIGDLEGALPLALELGASEFLLLPEQPVNGTGGINRETTEQLRDIVKAYRGKVRLAVSENAAEGLPVCDPLAAETGLRAYAHIDAAGVLRPSSYSADGIPTGNNFMRALANLNQRTTL